MRNDGIHPARRLAYDDLVAGLERARAFGLVYQRTDPATGLALFAYTSRCVFEDGWDEVSTMARGLVLDPVGRTVVATPFPKFFNLGERRGTAPDGVPFEAFEKLDGSLIIVFHHVGRWRCATKGAFDSEQAQWAQARIDRADTSTLSPGTTYLFEATYPENRIVVRYAEAALVILAAYAADGHELPYAEIAATAAALGWRAATRHAFASLADMVAQTANLPKDNEGFVVRFADGTRLKIKGAEYRRIHALISRCTPLAMWEAMAAGDDLAAIRRDLPEEFWTDFDDIVGKITERITTLENRVAETAATLAHLSDKELGLILKTVPAEVRPYLFGYRKTRAIVGHQRDGLMRAVRPTGNVLPGYVPSFAVARMLDDAIS